MRVSISNIAWDPHVDDAVAAILQRVGIDAIDVAPTKYFPDVSAASDAEVRRVRSWWHGRGVEIVGMQSLLFGLAGLNIFGGQDSRKKMLAHLDHVCRIAAGLGAVNLVFGSPKNRDRMSLDDVVVDEIAADFFYQLGEVAKGHGVVICLEPNPPVYGANFMINSAETFRVVSMVNHPAIRMQLDVGASTINNESPETVLRTYGHVIGHIHLSEPGLIEVGRGTASHQKWATLMHGHGFELAAIEMVGADISLDGIDRSVRFARSVYGRDRVAESAL